MVPSPLVLSQAQHTFSSFSIILYDSVSPEFPAFSFLGCVLSLFLMCLYWLWADKGEIHPTSLICSWIPNHSLRIWWCLSPTLFYIAVVLILIPSFLYFHLECLNQPFPFYYAIFILLYPCHLLSVSCHKIMCVGGHTFCWLNLCCTCACKANLRVTLFMFPSEWLWKTS